MEGRLIVLPLEMGGSACKVLLLLLVTLLPLDVTRLFNEGTGGRVGIGSIVVETFD